MAYSFLRAESITYASKGIELECEKYFKVRNHTKQLTIINTFKANDFSEPKSTTLHPLKCVWFSQNIGPNRGLEQIFEAAKSLSHIEFHLVGNQNPEFLKIITISDNIIFHDIMQQSELHIFLAKMDVGLALEPGKDLNNLIALSNKIITYAQGGLYILATDTFGQCDFLKSLDYNAGLIMTSSLENALQNLDNDLLSTNSKIGRWKNAKFFSWDYEQLKLKEVVS